MRAFTLLAMVVISSAFGHATAQEAKVVLGKPLPGGGVACPALKTGYFPNTTGGIDALDLTTGKVLWSSKEASRPLVAAEAGVLAQRTEKGKPNQIRIVILHAGQQGKRTLESQPIVFPDWVSVEVAYGRSFHTGVRGDGKRLWLAWSANAFYAGGARPTPEIEKAARKSASGVARVDLETGKVEMLTAEQIAIDKAPSIGSEAVNSKVGTLTLTLKDGPAKNAKNPFERRRTLQALNDAKEVVWQHDIAAPVFLLPRP